MMGKQWPGSRSKPSPTKVDGWRCLMLRYYLRSCYWPQCRDVDGSQQPLGEAGRTGEGIHKDLLAIAQLPLKHPACPCDIPMVGHNG